MNQARLRAAMKNIKERIINAWYLVNDQVEVIALTLVLTLNLSIAIHDFGWISILGLFINLVAGIVIGMGDND